MDPVISQGMNVEGMAQDGKGWDVWKNASAKVV